MVTNGLERMFYISRATRDLSREELDELLRDARACNEERDITGMLLYDAGHFAQVVEGPPASIHSLFESIQRDPRHADIQTVTRGPVDERDFVGWSMGYANLEEHKEPDLDAIKKLMRTQDVGDPMAAYRFLLAFQRTS